MNVISSASLFLLLSAVPLSATAAPLPAAQPPAWPFAIDAGHRPGTYFWCPGSALTREDIDWNLQQLRDGGFGFVHVIPIYGARGAESRYLSYLSPQWMAMLDYMVRKARSLGLFVDMTTGTGWCFGGPDLPPDAVDARVRYDAKTNTVSLRPAMKVKRAAPGGEGPMLNPFSPRAMPLYLQRFSKAFDDSHAATPRAQYHDSFEYRSDWCAELLDEFQKRLGYDLRPHLPRFFDDKSPDDRQERARLKCDYRQVLAELHLESIQRWTEWAHQRGMLTRDQAHGSPTNLLDVYAASDIPETEMFGAPEFPIPGFRRDPKMVRPGDSDPRICMLAASAAHVAHPPGRQLVCSESCTWLREHWHGSLAQIKLELDLFFLSGVNQMLFHGTCYSPKDAPWPGWFFYASTKMDWRNSVWHDVRYLTDYVARCQSVLQAGQPANDVLLYWPIHDLWMNPHGTSMPLTVHGHEWMAAQPIGRVANELLANGFSFDFISDEMVEGLKVNNRSLIAPGGTYRALVVPACRYIPEKTLERLAVLAEQGVPIVFEKGLPSDVPGLAQLETRRAKFKATLPRLQTSAVVAADRLAAALTRSGVPREAMADAGLRCIRRKVGPAHWYYIANHTAKAFDGWLPLSTSCVSATLFDPMTGQSGRLKTRTTDRQPQVYLQLEAGAAIVLRADSMETSGPEWPYLTPAAEPIVLKGQWSVEFIDGGPELPAAYATSQLASWASTEDTKRQAFAGTARYRLSFTLPAVAADDWLLDLGDVRESARVRINGRDAGALVALPYRMPVGRFLKVAPLSPSQRQRSGSSVSADLKPGENVLEVEVTNLSANRIRDLERRKVDWKVMKDINIVNVNYQRFEPDKWPLEPSGLLGPVNLIPAKRLHP